MTPPPLLVSGLGRAEAGDCFPALAAQQPRRAGAGGLSLAPRAVDLRVSCLPLPGTSPGRRPRLSLLFRVSAPGPSDALPHTGRPGPLLPSGKETPESGGFSVPPLLHPTSGASVSGLGAQGVCCLDWRVGLGRGLSARGSQQGEAQARKLLFWPKAGRARCGPQGPGLERRPAGQSPACSRLGRSPWVKPRPWSQGPLRTSGRLGLCPLAHRGWVRPRGEGDPVPGAAAWGSVASLL